MKALEFLKQERAHHLAVHNDKSIIDQYDEAIEELEDLKIRSCATCKYGRSFHFDEDIECMKLGADTQGLYFEKDFYCKKIETYRCSCGSLGRVGYLCSNKECNKY